MPTNYPNRWRALAVIRGGLHAPWTFADMRGGARPLVCIHGRLQAFTETTTMFTYVCGHSRL